MGRLATVLHAVQPTAQQRKRGVQRGAIELQREGGVHGVLATANRLWRQRHLQWWCCRHCSGGKGLQQSPSCCPPGLGLGYLHLGRRRLGCLALHLCGDACRDAAALAEANKDLDLRQQQQQVCAVLVIWSVGGSAVSVYLVEGNGHILHRVLCVASCDKELRDTPIRPTQRAVSLTLMWERRRRLAHTPHHTTTCSLAYLHLSLRHVNAQGRLPLRLVHGLCLSHATKGDGVAPNGVNVHLLALLHIFSC